MKKITPSLTILLAILLCTSCSKNDQGNTIDQNDNDEFFKNIDIPSTGLVAYYPFNGNVDDESNNENNGTNFGARLTTDRFGNENAAYEFDGLDDYIEIIPMSDVSAVGDFTFSVWTYLESWENQEGFNELDFQYVFNGHAHSNTVTSDFFRPGFNIAFRLNNNIEEKLQNYFLYDIEDITNNYLVTNSSLQLSGQWRHLVWGRRGNQDFSYVDGTLFDQIYLNQVNKSTLMDMQHAWYIGTFSGNNPNYNGFNYNFHGKIDDIRFYNIALEENFIKAIYLE